MKFEKECRTLPNQRSRFLRYKFGKNISYNTSIVIEISQHPELEIVNTVVNKLMDRHELLRTIFCYRNGEVLQRVYNKAKFKSRVKFKDISGKNKKTRERLFERFTNYMFDLETEPAFKCILTKNGKKKYVFSMVLDHIIYDTESIKIIEKEIFFLYEAQITGSTKSLKTSKVRFSDFVNHYYQHYQGNQLKYHTEYFKKVFNNSPLVPHRLKMKDIYLQKPDNIESNKHNRLDRKTAMKSLTSLDMSKDVVSKNYNGYCFLIPSEISDKVLSISRKMNIPPSIFILASFCFLMKKVNYQNDLIIDVPISLRNEEMFKELVGWLDSALLVRINIRDLSFDSLILECRDIVYEAFDHRFYQKYFAHLGILEKHESFTSCQVNIIDDLESHTTLFHPFHYSSESIIFDFEFQINMFKNGFKVSCKYMEELIQKIEVRKVCDEYIYLLEYQTNRLMPTL
ncbi:condensation domain-containing protein [Maribacter sp. 2307UL18-2]|uniref:condensation domain-containing protein n=1 Tax=Maribacter sp. 2307UL18-2 TaxID=3386274 RepID=UPI0039BC98A3